MKETREQAAARQRRYYRHRKGDHSLCDDLKCPVLAVEKALEAKNAPEAASEPSEGVQEPPKDAPMLGKGGQKLFDAVRASGVELTPLQEPLLLEACRLVDRLDRLDLQLHGGDWVRFRVRNDAATEIIVVVDRLLAEAREQATALKNIVAELTKAGSGIQEKQKLTTKSGGGGLVDLAAIVAARSAQATG